MDFNDFSKVHFDKKCVCYVLVSMSVDYKTSTMGDMKLPYRCTRGRVSSVCSQV